jgi:hypothetical protein
VSRRDERDPTAPPRTVQEALRRASTHAQASLGEAAAAMRCLLDAGSLAATGVPAGGHEALRGVAAWLERAAQLAREGDGGGRWLDAVADALDAEVARWEARGRDDAEARAVLRAFLGVREILWEFGLRPSGDTRRPRAGARARAPEPPGAAAPPRPPLRPLQRTPRARLERVPVEG